MTRSPVGGGAELGLVFALDPSTGREKWTREDDAYASNTTQIAAAGGLVFVGSTDDPKKTVHAFDAGDGSERWSTSTLTGMSEGGLGDDMVAAYGFLYVTTTDGVVALDAATGTARF